MESKINVKQNNNKIDNDSFKDYKEVAEENKKTSSNKSKITLGIRTTDEIKKFFEQDVEGNSADEKMRKLKIAYEKIKDQENKYKTGISDYIRNIENILSSVGTQLIAIDNLFYEKERQMKDEYAEFIGKELKNMQKELDDIEELKSKIEYLNKENKTLALNLEEKKRLTLELEKENTKILDSNKQKDASLTELKLENNELLKKVNLYMETQQVNSQEYEIKLDEIKREYKELDIANTIKEHKIEELEIKNVDLKEQLKSEKEEYRFEIKELNKEHKQEIKNLNEIINNQNSKIEELNRKIFELQFEKKK